MFCYSFVFYHYFFYWQNQSIAASIQCFKPKPSLKARERPLLGESLTVKTSKKLIMALSEYFC